MEQKLYFPDKDIDFNRAFESFLKEIDDHLNHVLQKLGWVLTVPPRFTRGHGSVVIHLTTRDGDFIFRVPRYSQKQLRKIHLAYRLFGEQSCMPKKYYHDGKCVIEEYVEGPPASSQMTLSQCEELGRRLKQLHVREGFGFGPLVYDHTGKNETAEKHYAKRMTDQFRYLQDKKILAAEEICRLESFFTAGLEKLSNRPVVVCHGDLSPGNIILGAQIKFIDWDNIAVYPREFDFIFLHELDFSEAQKKHLCDSYGQEIDLALVFWRTIFRIVTNIRDVKQKRIDSLRGSVSLIDGFF